MKRISVNVPDNMYDALNDLASQHHVPMSLYTRNVAAPGISHRS
jgi:hypothetical protein